MFHPPWFQGGGQKLRLRAQFGARREDYELTFIEPWLFGRKLQFSTDLYHRDLQFVSLNDLYNLTAHGSALWAERPRERLPDRRDQLHDRERFNLRRFDECSTGHSSVEAGLPIWSQRWAPRSPTTRETNSLMPTKGQRTELRGEIAGGPLGGDTDFYKFELGSAWYFKGFGQGHVFE